MFDFKNKKVIVTGATGGIGDAIVNRFIDQEAKVLATGTNIEKLKLLKDKHNNIFTSRFDILNHEEIEKFVHEIGLPRFVPWESIVIFIKSDI